MGDIAGNSKECRDHWLEQAIADPTTNCQHAGPGTGVNGAGTCGDACGKTTAELPAQAPPRVHFAFDPYSANRRRPRRAADNYCNLRKAYCGDTDWEACKTTCGAFATTGANHIGTGDTLQCRVSDARKHATPRARYWWMLDRFSRFSHHPYPPLQVTYGMTASSAVEAVSAAECAKSAPVSTHCADTCNTYCANFNSTCAVEMAFNDNTDCLLHCAAYPIGTTADTTGNTLGCRSYHLTLATDAAAATTHCPRASPYGIAADGSSPPTQDQSCGTACEHYCGMVMETCLGADAQYATTAECLDSCSYFPFDNADPAKLTLGAATGDTLQCRM